MQNEFGANYCMNFVLEIPNYGATGLNLQIKIE